MTQRRMLFITPVMPDAGGNGLAMRQGQFLAAYAPHFAIDLAVIPLAGPAEAAQMFARRHVARMEVFAAGGMDTHFALLSRLRDPAQRLAAFEAYGRPSILAGLTAALQAQVSSWIAGEAYHLIHIGRLYMLGVHTKAGVPRLVDADEDDARVFAQMARETKDKHKAAWLRAEAAHAARQAQSHLPGTAHIFAASQVDAAALRDHGPPVTVIPNVVGRHWPPARCPARRLLFVGTLSYAPNQDGVAWFLKYCWPRLRKLMPGVKLDIVGRGGVLRTKNGARRHGWQRDIARFYQRAGVVIVPIRAGGGSRIKLLEAASHGVPIVATRIGASGAGLQPKRDYLQADDPQNFIRAVREAWRARRLGVMARRSVARGHDTAAAGQRIAAIAIAKSL